MSQIDRIPEQGFMTVKQIVKDPKNKDKIPLIPITEMCWYQRVKKGIYPQPIKHGRSSFYKNSDIIQLLKDIENGLTVS